MVVFERRLAYRMIIAWDNQGALHHEVRDFIFSQRYTESKTSKKRTIVCRYVRKLTHILKYY